MKSELERIVAKIPLQPIELRAVIHRGRREMTWRVTMLSIVSIVLSVALIMGGVAARALVHEEDTSPPSAPFRARAKAIAPRKVIVTWKAATDNVDVTGFVISRNLREIETVDETIFSYTDTTVRPEKTYRYRIIALDAAGNRSDRSKVARVTTPALSDGGSGGTQPSPTPSVTTPSPVDSEPPTAPSNVTVEPAEAGGWTINWFPSSDNVGVLDYVIQRDDVQIGVVRHPTTTFSDGSDLCEGTYTFEVIAIDGAGNKSEPGSDELSVVC